MSMTKECFSVVGDASSRIYCSIRTIIWERVNVNVVIFKTLSHGLMRQWCIFILFYNFVHNAHNWIKLRMIVQIWKEIEQLLLEIYQQFYLNWQSSGNFTNTPCISIILFSSILISSIS
jgi:hypothetical protein